MTLTAQQLVDTRRYCGYSLSGNVASQPFREPVNSSLTYESFSLEYRLANLSAEEENTLTTFFLTNLAQREAEIQSAAASLGVGSAGPFTRNPQEISERRSLFRQLRLDLCTFLGFSPGPDLTSTNRLVRA